MQTFYVEVFGCVPLRNIDHLKGRWIEDITAVENSEIKYVHLRFPGHGANGPELELIQYLNHTKQLHITPDTYGFGHLSFGVADVHKALEEIIAAVAAVWEKSSRSMFPTGAD